MARRRSGGFTLIEVVVAFAIAAFALGTLLQLFAGTLARESLLSEYRQALGLAESEMARLGRELPVRSGVEEVALGEGFRLRREVTPYDTASVGAGPLRAYRVVVSVSWPGRVQPHRITLTSVRLGAAS